MISAFLETSKERWIIDPRLFAYVVEWEKAKGNSIADSFYTTIVSTGKTCHDFLDLLSFASFSAIIYYVSPSFNYFDFNIGSRTADRWLKELNSRELHEIRELAKAYYEITN